MDNVRSFLSGARWFFVGCHGPLFVALVLLFFVFTAGIRYIYIYIHIYECVCALFFCFSRRLGCLKGVLALVLRSSMGFLRWLLSGRLAFTGLQLRGKEPERSETRRLASESHSGQRPSL